jgi:anti-sigma regulatory factor (Ser/Thr protein kinase)
MDPLSPQIQLRLSTRSQPDALRRARQALSTFEELQADSSFAFNASLLVSELVANVVRHGTPDDDGRVELEAELSKDCLRVEVRDHGSGIRLEPSRRPEPTETSGRGLQLLRTLADRYGTGEGGLVWFELDLASRDQRATHSL